MPKMKAAIFVEPNRIVIDDKPIPDVGPRRRRTALDEVALNRSLTGTSPGGGHSGNSAIN